MRKMKHKQVRSLGKHPRILIVILCLYLSFFAFLEAVVYVMNLEIGLHLYFCLFMCLCCQVYQHVLSWEMCLLPRKLFCHTTLKSSDNELRWLLQLRREKVELENALEQEQESLVNRLWKRMDKLEAEKRWGKTCLKHLQQHANH